MESKSELVPFDMEGLRNNLPQKRGLSRYYSGKARSFTCISDVKCLEDLKKQPPELFDANKKRKKQSSYDRNHIDSFGNKVHFPAYACRRVSSSTHFTSPSVGA